MSVCCSSPLSRVASTRLPRLREGRLRSRFSCLEGRVQGGTAPSHTRLFVGERMVGRREEEASQPLEVLAGEEVIGRGEEVTGWPPEVLAG